MSLLGRVPHDILAQAANPAFAESTAPSSSELYVTCGIYSKGQLIGLVESSTYKCFSNATDPNWDEWLTFPLKYSDLPPQACLAFTVYEVSESVRKPVVIGGTSMPVFTEPGLMKLGSRKLFVWPGVQGDGNYDSNTPYKAWERQGMERLDKVIRQYDQQELPRIKWLDGLTIKRIEKLQSLPIDDDRTCGPMLGIADSLSVIKANEENIPEVAKDPSKPNLFLRVEFPRFPHPIVYHEVPCNPHLHRLVPFSAQNRLFVAHDPEVNRDNPMELKYHKLARSSKGMTARELKPKIVERNEIEKILNNPNKLLQASEKELLWKFRYSLTDNKRSLTKFLRAVDWTDIEETKEALEMLEGWAPIDIADSLELLSSYFKNSDVRKYAVSQLSRADDDELQNYLLQLVQALRYEPHVPSDLSSLLITRCCGNMQLANFFHWYLMVERDGASQGQLFSRVHDSFLRALSKNESSKAWSEQLTLQGQLIDQLIQVADKSCRDKGKVQQKVLYFLFIFIFPVSVAVPSSSFSLYSFFFVSTSTCSFHLHPSSLSLFLSSVCLYHSLLHIPSIHRLSA